MSEYKPYTLDDETFSAYRDGAFSAAPGQVVCAKASQDGSKLVFEVVPLNSSAPNAAIAQDGKLKDNCRVVPPLPKN